MSSRYTSFAVELLHFVYFPCSIKLISTETLLYIKPSSLIDFSTETLLYVKPSSLID